MNIPTRTVKYFADLTGLQEDFWKPLGNKVHSKYTVTWAELYEKMGALTLVRCLCTLPEQTAKPRILAFALAKAPLEYMPSISGSVKDFYPFGVQLAELGADFRVSGCQGLVQDAEEKYLQKFGYMVNVMASLGGQRNPLSKQVFTRARTETEFYRARLCAIRAVHNVMSAQPPFGLLSMVYDDALAALQLNCENAQEKLGEIVLNHTRG